MKLKGDYSGETTYSVGDVVRFPNGHVYHLQAPAKAGTPCIDTAFWGPVDQIVEQCAIMIMDGVDIADSNDVEIANNLTTETAGKALDATQGKALNDAIEALPDIPTNISEDAITLKGSGDNEYLITVDDSGDTPELVATLIEAASDGGET